MNPVHRMVTAQQHRAAVTEVAHLDSGLELPRMLPGDRNVQGGCYRHYLGSSFGDLGLGRLNEWGIARHYLADAELTDPVDPNQIPEASGGSRIPSDCRP